MFRIKNFSRAIYSVCTELLHSTWWWWTSSWAPWGWDVMRHYVYFFFSIFYLFLVLCSLQCVAYDPLAFEDTLKSFANKVSVKWKGGCDNEASADVGAALKFAFIVVMTTQRPQHPRENGGAPLEVCLPQSNWTNAQQCALTVNPFYLSGWCKAATYP